MNFDLSSDGSSNGSSVVDLSTLLPGGKKNNEKNNCDEKKNIASTVGDEPSRLNNSESEDKSSNDIHFEFGNDSSSEGSSVVDISTLLPRNSIQSNNSDEIKSISSILGDVPSQLNINSVDKIGNRRDSIDYDEDNGRNESKQIDTKKNTSTYQQSSKKSSENTKDYGESKSDCKSRMMRIVMGESIKAWRMERNTTKNSKKATVIKKNIIHDSDTKPHGKHPQYALVQKRYSTSDPKSSNNNLLSPQNDFEISHLNVQRSSGGNGDRIEIVVGSSTRHGVECTDDEKNLRTMKYEAKKFKRQLSNHQTQTPLSSSTQLSTSTYVDCIAIWDPVRKVYVLEVPELVAHDVATTMTTLGDNDSDDDRDNAATALKNNPGNNRIHGDRHDSATRRPDPIEQQRQAERKVQSHRKRRRL